MTNNAPSPSAIPPSGSMHIGEVAARTELSLRTLRHYDEVGLLRPSGRTDGGFRLYTEADIDRILIIRRMKPLGFTLEQMGAALRHIETLRQAPPGSAPASAAQEMLGEIRREALERRGRLERQLGMADEFLSLLDRQLR